MISLHNKDVDHIIVKKKLKKVFNSI